ncbi:M23 family metallopeptidase [Thalassolituus sp. UBA2590]|mgnify:FL=1|uniref:M23 family metallopeptidase n=1 Tax=Thalassolituus sp. UBA2590 TaxID=1947663 RepID=UPI0026488B78|nr:M23 family metallopeptidase [Thalassolituus sp. UBA2590]
MMIKKTGLVLAPVLLSAFILNATASQTIEKSDSSESALPNHPIAGGIISMPLDKNSKVTLNDKPVLTTTVDGQRYAVIGVPLKAEESLQLKIDGKKQSQILENFAYEEQHIEIKNKRKVNPQKNDMDRIGREYNQMTPVYKSFSAELTPDWNQMILPTTGPYSSAFGLKRFFNGQARNPHSGIDIAAPEGKDIVAPAGGTVVLTGDFFFNGNSVFIDHGQGLISMMCHMSRVDVKEGDVIKQGDLLGAVGKTGRATGPHLHWTVSLNNARVNPKLLLRQDQPK